MTEWVCADALPWLAAHPRLGAIVTSLPDADELGAPLGEWARWFGQAVALCVAAALDAAPAIFYQTDRKADGQLYSKAALVLAGAAAAGARVLWHKIVLRRAPGAVDLHRPGYTHLIAVSRAGKPGAASPDVLARGRMLYPNAMGLAAAVFAVRFAGRAAPVVCDPFCGRGTVPAVAEALGLGAIGVDIDPTQLSAARRLRLAPPAGGRARAS
jgi:hypothetical protein